MDFKQCMKIHGFVFDSDSECSGKSDFDEEYYNLQPPPLPLEENKSSTVKIYSNENSHVRDIYKNKSNIIKITKESNANTVNKFGNFTTSKQTTQIEEEIQKNLADFHATQTGAVPKKKSSQHHGNVNNQHHNFKGNKTFTNKKYDRKNNFQQTVLETANKENLLGFYEGNFDYKQTNPRSVPETPKANVSAETYCSIVKKNTIVTNEPTKFCATNNKNFADNSQHIQQTYDNDRNKTIDIFCITNSEHFKNRNYMAATSTLRVNEPIQGDIPKETIYKRKISNKSDNNSDLITFEDAVCNRTPEFKINKNLHNSTKLNTNTANPLHNGEDPMKNTDVVIDINEPPTETTDFRTQNDETNNSFTECIITFFVRLFSICCVK